MKCKKVSYPRRKAALTAMNMIRAEESLYTHYGMRKRPCHAYKCTRCKGWHLTSMNRKTFYDMVNKKKKKRS